MQLLSALRPNLHPNDAVSPGNRHSLNMLPSGCLMKMCSSPLNVQPKSIISYFQDCSPAGGTWNHQTYRRHATDLIQSQLQELLVAALSHQLEGRLLQAVGTLEHQASDVSDALKRDRGRDGDRGGTVKVNYAGTENLYKYAHTASPVAAALANAWISESNLALPCSAGFNPADSN